MELDEDYTLERDVRELQQKGDPPWKSSYYTLERDVRELQPLLDTTVTGLHYTLERDVRELQLHSSRSIDK